MPEWFPTSYRKADEDGPAPYILFQNACVFNGKDPELSAPQSVLVKKNLISAVGPDIPTPTDGKVAIVDCGGKTLMPGLIDMHAHLVFQSGTLEGREDFDQMAMGAMSAHDLVSYLQQGFTSVRDAGGNTLGLAKSVNTGRIPGPRIFGSGAFISQTGGHGDFGCSFEQPGTSIIPSSLPSDKSRTMVKSQILYS